MKREYSKPEIMFESFTLSTSIAGDCETPFVGNASRGSCAVIGTGEIAIFNSQVGSVCVFTPTDVGGENDDMYDLLCYYLPSDESNLFNS